MNPADVIKPPFQVIPFAAGRAMTGAAGYRYEEKMDGVWHVREFAGAVVVGELMPSTAGNGNGLCPFYAFDILFYCGQDLRPLPLRERLRTLDDIYPSPVTLRRPAVGHGGEFLEAVLARGGEGIVAKRLDEPYGAPWLKCKRLEVFRCVVLEKDATGKRSVRLGSYEQPGRELGSCSLFGDKFDSVRVGSVLKIEAFGLTAAGRLREPRPCKDRPGSWLVSY